MVIHVPVLGELKTCAIELGILGIYPVAHKEILPWVAGVEIDQ
jgi:hypothetical protein